MIAKKLTEEQKIRFTEAFYALVNGLDDLETSSPWGCPWHWGKDVSLNGNSIQEMANNFYMFHKQEIEQLVC